MSEFSINEVEAGWLFSAYALSMVILLPLSGYLADRFGQKKLLLYGYLLSALGVTSMGLSQSYIGCLASYLVAGAGAGVLNPAYFSMVGEALTQVRGLAIGVASGVAGLGGLIGSVLVGFFVVEQQWRLAYLVLGVIILLMTAAQSVWVRSSPRQTRNGTELKDHISFTGLLRTRNILILSVSLFLAGVIYQVTLTWLPTFFYSYTRLDTPSVSISFGLFTLVSAVSSPMLGAISDRIGRSYVTCATGIATAAVSIPMFMTQYSFWPSISYSLALGFTAIPVYNLLLTLAQESVSREFSTSITGIAITFALVGCAVGPVITGALINVIGINQALVCTVTLPALIYGFLILVAVEKSKGNHITTWDQVQPRYSWR
jgi:MFS family permease